MSYIVWTIKHIPYIDNDWDTENERTLTRVVNPQVFAELGEGRDTFEFETFDSNGDALAEFNPNDKIIIYRTVNTDVLTDENVLMVGTVADTPLDINENRRSVKVKGYNLTEALMKAIVFFDAEEETPAQIIQRALLNASAKNEKFGVVWHEGNDAAIAGLSYPLHTERVRNKPIREILERYSSRPKVGSNVASYYFVDKDNKLVWRPRSETIDYTFNFNEDAILHMKVGKDLSGVRNFVILKGGADASNSQIQTRRADYSSISKHGMKYYFLISENNTAKDLIDVDVKDTYGSDPTPDGYPLIETTAFTTGWKSRHNFTISDPEIEVKAGQTITIDTGTVNGNKKAYNKIIRQHTILSLWDEGDEFIRNRRYGKLEIEVAFRAGEKPWQLGNLIVCALPQVGFQSEPLRVQQIQYTQDEDIFTLIQDEGTL